MSESDGERRFRALYEANVVALLGYVVRRVELREDATDVVAEVFTVVWRRIDDVPAGEQGRPWLYGVARNVLSNHQRSTLRRERLQGRVRHEHELTRSTQRLWDEEVHDVRRALWRLSAEDRELLLLTNWEGLSPTEVAVAMEIPRGRFAADFIEHVSNSGGSWRSPTTRLPAQEGDVARLATRRSSKVRIPVESEELR